jgi:hypothetical protein
MMIDIVSDTHDELLEVLEHSAPQPVLCQVAEESFDHVEPGC